VLQRSKDNYLQFLLTVALAGWVVPGAGYFLLKETKRGTIILVTIVLTFCVGLYIGSIGVIDPVDAKPWYVAQMMNSPFVAVLGHLTKGGAYPVRGKPSEIAQIYTSIAGLLNLLCIVNAVYLGHQQVTQGTGDQQ
jgi:uncharacterized membrane protein